MVKFVRNQSGLDVTNGAAVDLAIKGFKELTGGLISTQLAIKNINKEEFQKALFEQPTPPKRSFLCIPLPAGKIEETKSSKHLEKEREKLVKQVQELSSGKLFL